MSIIQVNSLNKSFGAHQIFHDVSFQIEDHEKVALIGPNGSGKTTLLKCLTGEENYDAGKINISNNIKLGYLQQILTFPPGTSFMSVMLESFRDVYEMRSQMDMLLDIMSATDADDELDKIMKRYSALCESYENMGGYSTEAMIRRISAGLGFHPSDFERDINSFSGGEKTRASLARVLVRPPDILLLDEPTNHLDIEAMEWLESFLKSFNGALIIISHDRYFLDSISSRTLELSAGVLKSYPGNYSTFLNLKAEEKLTLQREYTKQQKIIQQTEEYIEKYKAGIKSKQARGRQSRLNRMTRLEKPVQERSLHLAEHKINVKTSGDLVLDINDLGFGYNGTDEILHGVQLTIHKKEKVCLIGANGCGKSTVLKLVMGMLQPDAGSIRIGSRVERGYFDQHHADLHPELTVLEEITQCFDINEGEARNRLADFLFRNDDVYKNISSLSGGEQGRLAFLKLLLSDANFLVLDEPTNHLDISSKEIIEEFLADYGGTILAVSHDRYFLDKIATRIIELNDGCLYNYDGNYSYYKDVKEKLQGKNKENEIKKESAKKSYKDQKSRSVNNKPRINKVKVKKDIAELEQSIEIKEKRMTEISALLADAENYKQDQGIKELISEYNELEITIPELYGEWERLSDLLAE